MGRIPNLLASRGSAPSDRTTVRKAWILAIAADWVQLVMLPFFAMGALSPLNDLLDVAVAAIMIRWLGWHPAFLPTFIAELVPGLGLFPTWTLSVWIATRGRKRESKAVVTS